MALSALIIHVSHDQPRPVQAERDKLKLDLEAAQSQLFDLASVKDDFDLLQRANEEIVLNLQRKEDEMASVGSENDTMKSIIDDLRHQIEVSLVHAQEMAQQARDQDEAVIALQVAFFYHESNSLTFDSHIIPRLKNPLWKKLLETPKSATKPCKLTLTQRKRRFHPTSVS